MKAVGHLVSVADGEGVEEMLTAIPALQCVCVPPAGIWKKIPSSQMRILRVPRVGKNTKAVRSRARIHS